MTGLSTVAVNDDKTIASVGAGASWLDVYLYLDHLGVAVAGARNAAVGVGGFTLGGLSLLLIWETHALLTLYLCRRYIILCASRRVGMRQRRKF